MVQGPEPEQKGVESEAGERGTLRQRAAGMSGVPWGRGLAVQAAGWCV